MTEQEAREIYHQGEEAVVAKFMEFDARLKKLEEMLGMNSSNSSKPASTDNKLTKNRDKKSSKTRKKCGGQVGHKGRTLKISATPDVVNILTVNHCKCCKNSLDETGINIKGKLYWIHVASSKKLTYYMAHQKRGAKAI